MKPVLFAHLEEEREPKRLEPPDAWVEKCVLDPLRTGSSSDPYRGDARLHDAAWVIDLFGAESARTGIAFASHGYRPIPLYNAVPSSSGLVDLAPLMALLVDGAPAVTKVPRGSPPAFLLDARRMEGRPRVGAFDNRSRCSASDFPSSETLLSAGIRRAVVLARSVAADLEPVLLAWQRRGIQLWRAEPDSGETARPFELRRTWLRRGMFLLQASLLRRRDDGTYGMLIEPPTGG